MRWSRLRKWAISLPAAFLAALVLISINEVGYYRSNDSLQNLSITFQTRTTLDKLMQQMADAETNVRGYLLTGEDLPRHLPASLHQRGQRRRRVARHLQPVSRRPADFIVAGPGSRQAHQ